MNQFYKNIDLEELDRTINLWLEEVNEVFKEPDTDKFYEYSIGTPEQVQRVLKGFKEHVKALYEDDK